MAEASEPQQPPEEPDVMAERLWGQVRATLSSLHPCISWQQHVICFLSAGKKHSSLVLQADACCR